MDDVVPGTFEEFNRLVRKSLAPHVQLMKSKLDEAVAAVTAKIKAWGTIHLIQARKLGKRTELFEKLVNNPATAARQIVFAMLDVKSGVPNAEPHVITDPKEEAARIDDVLQTISI